MRQVIKFILACVLFILLFIGGFIIPLWILAIFMGFPAYLVGVVFKDKKKQKESLFFMLSCIHLPWETAKQFYITGEID